MIISPPTSDIFGTLDLLETYNSSILFIESIRSDVNITNPNTGSLLNKFTEETFIAGSGQKNISIENSKQESRCHAFYRLIGFPVVSKNGFYNPGISVSDSSNNFVNQLTISDKVNIANEQLNDFNNFKKISNDRENYQNKILSIFSKRNTIDSSILAISCVNVRDFNVPFLKDSSAIEENFKSSNQQYEILNKSIVGDNSIKYSEYLNSSGLPPEEILLKRNHIIKPFIVDARIDITTPSVKKIGVPFVLNDSHLLVSQNTYAFKPLLEKIIRERFLDQSSEPDNDEYLDSIIDYIKQIPSIKEEELIKDISSGNKFKYREVYYFNKYFKYITMLMRELANNIFVVNEVQSEYYFNPIPNRLGPEFGCEVPEISLNINTSSLYTSKDLSIIESLFKFTLESLTSKEVEPNVSDGFANVGFDIDINLNINNKEQYNQLILKRNNQFIDGINALRNIEIITGEFSGLGLCDIIAIKAALYTVDRDILLGLLDVDAYERAKTFISIPTNNPTNVLNALQTISDRVQDYYNIMNKIFLSFNSASS